MRRASILLTLVAITTFGMYFFFSGKKAQNHKGEIEKQPSLFGSGGQSVKAENNYKRWLYEWKMLHDPATGEIPRDIHRKEAALLASIIAKQKAPGFRGAVNNSYTAAGPNQNGGRTRALAFDMRNNQVVLAGGISGGIFRSADGGNNWAFVHPSSELRNVSCIAQDPRPGFQDTWYAGTGELIGASADYPNTFIPGNGIFKSTDNGITWTRLPATNSANDKESFDSPFDIVFNLKVDMNGYVFAAILNYILVLKDGIWGYVLRESSEFSKSPQNFGNMITDIEISKPGISPIRYFASFTGSNGNRDTAGVWTSANGLNGWARIAGGSFGSPDSVAGWKAYNSSLSGGTGWGRTILSSAPSNSNILYVMYENSLSASSNESEADLFKADLSTNPINWSSNRNANLKATRINPLTNTSSTKYMETQGGYNMLLAVHPTNPNLVVAGGVNLFRSTDGFSTQGTFIGGLTSTTFTDPNQYSHVDFHSFTFDPSNANRMAVGDDGGLQVTNDVTAASVTWNNFASQYQTMQYYHVAIDPVAGSLVFAGGTQDNSTTYRDAKGLFGFAPADANDHLVGIIGGDGGMAGLSPSTPTQQYLYGSAQNGYFVRFALNGSPSPTGTFIKPSAAGDGEFITYFHLDQENTETLYFVSTDSIWRTTSASTVTPSAGWTLMTGIPSTLSASIFSLATSRGAYAGAGSYLYIGTSNGKIYRMQDPKNAVASIIPVDISPFMSSGSLVREIAVNPRNADTVLAVVSNYGTPSAFWTGNATSASPSWQEVEGSTIALTSFRSCAIVVTSTGVEYYVGTSIGLFSTTAINGNSTIWSLEGTSMMQGALVNDLVLRTADNTLLIGTHGNGMFYTTIGNVPTPVPDIIQNDKRFIAAVFPTITNQSVNFRTGKMTGIKTISIKLYNMKGQAVIQETLSYQDGSLPINQLPAGSYILNIVSDNRKYKHVQKIIKTH